MTTPPPQPASSWRVARSLDVLLAEINKAAPHRNKSSDGSIGDPAHSARTSDHNPNSKGVVRARDFTHDPKGGLDCHRLADFLAAKLRAADRHPALGPGAYVIWNRRIISRDKLAQGWRAYPGTNPHTHHLHLSVATAASGYDSTAAWGWPPAKTPTRLPAVDLSNVREQFLIAAGAQQGRLKALPGVKRIQAALNAEYKAGLKVDGIVGPKTLAAWGKHEAKVGGTGRARVPDEKSLTALAKGRFRVVP